MHAVWLLPSGFQCALTHEQQNAWRWHSVLVHGHAATLVSRFGQSVGIAIGSSIVDSGRFVPLMHAVVGHSSLLAWKCMHSQHMP